MTYNFQKRVLDIVVALILLVMFLPVWIVIPILIYLDSGFPIFFRHKRIGRNGRRFYLYKFRSMVQGADDILHKHDRKLKEKFINNDWKIKAKDDPRITKLGRIIRSLTIDEFPQLYNVLKGDMSMVGPRAYLEEELKNQTKKYPSTQKLIIQILSVKPGITGPWQTSGRNDIPFNRRAKMDADYADRKTIKQDISILFKTPVAMLSKW